MHFHLKSIYRKIMTLPWGAQSMSLCERVVKGITNPLPSCSRPALHPNLQFTSSTKKIFLTGFLKTNCHRRQPLNFILYPGISVSGHKYRNKMFWQCLSCAYHFHKLRTCNKINFWSWDEMHAYIYMKSIYESTLKNPTQNN